MNRIDQQTQVSKWIWIVLVIFLLAIWLNPSVIPWIAIIGGGFVWVLRKKNRTICLEKRQNRSLEASLHRTQKQVAVSEEQLGHMEKLAMMGELTAGVAHELKNPINYLANSTLPLQRNFQDLTELIDKYQLLHEGDDLSTQLQAIKAFEQEIDLSYLLTETAQLINGMVEGTNRTRSIVMELREFSQEENNEKVETQVTELLESTLTLLHVRMKSGIEIQKNYDPDLPSIYAYSGRLKQVFMNVLDNAIHAMGGQGTIHLDIWQEGRYVCVKITDDGNGISPDVINHIFEPFYSTKGKSEGTGLGLYISKRIIDRHSGEIKVFSTVGQGTTFEIWLPLK